MRCDSPVEKDLLDAENFDAQNKLTLYEEAQRYPELKSSSPNSDVSGMMQ